MQPQRNAASIVNTVFEIHDFDEVTDDVSWRIALFHFHCHL